MKEDARHKYRIVSDKHNHTVALEVANVKAEDGGEYRVLARNDHGEGHANITLNFEGGLYLFTSFKSIRKVILK